MKALIALLIIVAVCLGGWKLFEYYNRVSEHDRPSNPETTPGLAGDQLPGLPYQLEASVKQAEEAGPKALKQWLDTYKKSPLVKDPRLAWIELDYVLLVAHTDPLEAKRVFAAVKQRTPPDSPVYPRVQALAKTYE